LKIFNHHILFSGNFG